LLSSIASISLWKLLSASLITGVIEALNAFYAHICCTQPGSFKQFSCFQYCAQEVRKTILEKNFFCYFLSTENHNLLLKKIILFHIFTENHHPESAAYVPSHVLPALA
jgi:hypothetical protein